MCSDLVLRSPIMCPPGRLRNTVFVHVLSLLRCLKTTSFSNGLALCQCVFVCLFLLNYIFTHAYIYTKDLLLVIESGEGGGGKSYATCKGMKEA